MAKAKRIKEPTTPEEIRSHFWGLKKSMDNDKEMVFTPRRERDPKDFYLYDKAEIRLAFDAHRMLDLVREKIKPMDAATLEKTFGKFVDYVRKYFSAEIVTAKNGADYIRLPR